MGAAAPPECASSMISVSTGTQMLSDSKLFYDLALISTVRPLRPNWGAVTCAAFVAETSRPAIDAKRETDQMCVRLL
jgi:hypothetical protein